MASWWRCNLPCAHGRATGCENHNTDQKTIYHDKSVHSIANDPSSRHTNQTNIEEMNYKGSFEIHSCLRIDPATTRSLPQVHASLVYTLAFYHVNAIMSCIFNSSDTGKVCHPNSRSPLQALACRGKNTQTCWTITPKISAIGTFLLEYDLSLNVANEIEPENQKWGFQKQFLIFSSLRKIVLCPHMTRKFHSAWMKTRDGVHQFGLKYSLSNILGHKFSGEWQSDTNIQPQNVCCAMCYTDTWMNITIVGTQIVVRILIHKDLGYGLDPNDPQWMATVEADDKARKNIRDTGDFGRIRSEFM